MDTVKQALTFVGFFIAIALLAFLRHSQEVVDFVLG